MVEKLALLTLLIGICIILNASFIVIREMNINPNLNERLKLFQQTYTLLCIITGLLTAIS
jgi:hypothetical protein